MTAPGERGDAELVAGLRAGDQRCLAGIYDRYADRLYDFCAGMLRDRDEAADAVQDTLLLVNGRIGQLRDPERLRPWLYAIARSVALNRARAPAELRDRVLGDAALVAHSSPMPDGDPGAAPAPGATLPAVPARRRRSPAARGVAAALVVAALAGVALLWGTRSVTLSETPTLPHEPVTSGPAGPSTGAAPAVLNPPPPIPDTTTDPAPRPPRIVGQDVSPPRLGPRGCPDDRADVRVTLAAEAPATAVVLSWTKAGESGSMAMRGSGTTWSGSLGPFREPGRVPWSVTASNAAGSTTGPAEEIAVTSCTVRGTIR